MRQKHFVTDFEAFCFQRFDCSVENLPVTSVLDVSTSQLRCHIFMLLTYFYLKMLLMSFIYIFIDAFIDIHFWFHTDLSLFWTIQNGSNWLKIIHWFILYGHLWFTNMHMSIACCRQISSTPEVTRSISVNFRF